jgi:seryl-tRNA synthetase
MLDVDLICNNLDIVIAGLAKRGINFDAENFKHLNDRRRHIIREVELLKARRNVVSKEIANLKQTGSNTETLIIAQREVSDQIKQLETLGKEAEIALTAFLTTIPNLPHESVPIGKDHRDNVEIKRWGTPATIENPLDHVELGSRLDILDLDRAAKLSGTRFSVTKGLGAKMERALASLMADLHSAAGWTEVSPPYLVLPHCMFGTGQLPKFEQDLFKTFRGDDVLYLIPTAEVPVTNLYRDEIISEEQLPLRYFACTPCFRSEAGSYGKDTKGIIRQHQFQKVELVTLVTPKKAQEELEYLTSCAENVLKILELPYRKVLLSTGDTGFASQKTFDLEVWLPSQNGYREISSCSWFGDFQARRAHIRYRTATNKPKFLHTINGSGLAIGRTWVAILENYQQPNGSIRIPRALQPYMNCELIG